MNTTTEQQTIVSPAIKKFNIVKKILDKSIFHENVIHIIFTKYWKDFKNKRKVLVDWTLFLIFAPFLFYTIQKYFILYILIIIISYY
jgi:hypothetical protein